MQPNTKMSSGQATFDLKAAREAMARATERPNVTTDIYHLAALTYLPAALDEIERLQAAYLKAQNSNLLRKQAYESLEKIANKQRAALKKLGQAKRARGKALVEERISGEFSDWIENQCPHWDIDEEPFCVELDGPCEYHEGKCPISMELHRIAREQLRREGLL